MYFVLSHRNNDNEGQPCTLDTTRVSILCDYLILFYSFFSMLMCLLTGTTTTRTTMHDSLLRVHFFFSTYMLDHTHYDMCHDVSPFNGWFVCISSFVSVWCLLIFKISCFYFSHSTARVANNVISLIWLIWKVSLRLKVVTLSITISTCSHLMHAFSWRSLIFSDYSVTGTCLI